jgi:hypothetical protein
MPPLPLASPRTHLHLAGERRGSRSVTDTIEKLDDLITRMVNDLHTAYTNPGSSNPLAVVQFAAALESLTNTRLRLPLDRFAKPDR